ncbi:hypothetical protein [Baaleninema sp.]
MAVPWRGRYHKRIAKRIADRLRCGAIATPQEPFLTSVKLL